MKILETSRLYLREITPDDAEIAFQLNADPLVVRYTGDKPFASVEAARDFLAGYDHYRKYGYGRWGVISKENEAFLGWCGLKYTPDLDEIDLGFRFFREHWNQGYATESGLACMDWGFSRGMDRLVGRAMAANLGSIRVLEKVGMRYMGPAEFDGESGVLYEIHKGEFRK